MYFIEFNYIRDIYIKLFLPKGSITAVACVELSLQGKKDILEQKLADLQIPTTKLLACAASVSKKDYILFFFK